jgi:hypothetical protein
MHHDMRVPRQKLRHIGHSCALRDRGNLVALELPDISVIGGSSMNLDLYCRQ